MIENLKAWSAQKASDKTRGRGKSFKVDKVFDVSEADSVALEVAVDSRLNIILPKNPSSTRNINLCKHKGKGFDPLLPGIHYVFSKAVESSINSGQKTLAISTIAGYYSSGLMSCAGFFSVLSNVLQRDLMWCDINKNVIGKYKEYLVQCGLSYSGQKSTYTSLKGLFALCFKAGLLPHIKQFRDLFPANAYPNSNKTTKGQRPFSKSEFKRLAKAVRDDYKSITQGDQPLTSYELSVCILALAIRTGINVTPALEMPVDCLQPHPLKEDRMTLVWFKRRGNATHIQSARKSEEVAEIKAIQFDVVDLIELVRSRNAVLRQDYESPERLFVYIPSRSNNVTDLQSSSFAYGIASLIEKHSLVDDDGRPLKVNLSRLKKTFVNRIFELSGGDPLVTAMYGRHSVQTANNHYWEAPRSAEANHRRMIESRTEQLIATDLQGGESATPIAMCRDTINGHRAPKNGEHCTEILACFRCKSFVVTKDDMHRLYSFYWSLIEDRKNSDTKTWQKHFRHIRQIIDENIAPQFDTTEIDAVKENAKINRDPFWKDLTMLRMSK